MLCIHRLVCICAYATHIQELITSRHRNMQCYAARVVVADICICYTYTAANQHSAPQHASLAEAFKGNTALVV
jgi:hypothetical protein